MVWPANDTDTQRWAQSLQLARYGHEAILIGRMVEGSKKGHAAKVGRPIEKIGLPSAWYEKRVWRPQPAADLSLGLRNREQNVDGFGEMPRLRIKETSQTDNISGAPQAL